MAVWVTTHHDAGYFRIDESRQRVRVGDRSFWPEIQAVFASVDGQPSLTLDLAIIDGRPQCRRLTIEAVDDGREVAPRDLAAVDLPTWIEAIFASTSLRLVSEVDGITTWDMEAFPETPAGNEAWRSAVGKVRQSRKGRGARKLNDAFYRKVAEVYRANVHSNPTKTVAEQFGVSPRMASKYVQGARDRGILGPAEPGKAGER